MLSIVLHCIVLCTCIHYFVCCRNLSLFPGCTFSHFESNHNCPSCDQVMGENDFTELMIRKNPPPHKDRKRIHSRICVKATAESRPLDSMDIWKNIQRQYFIHREATKFVLQQMEKEIHAQTKWSSGLQHALIAMKEESDALKRENHKQKQKMEEFKQELIRDHEKIDEKDRQLKQFRKMFDSRKTPPSSYQDQGLRGGVVAGTTRGGQESSARPKSRPRRVSDQHFPPSSARGSSGRHSHSSYDSNAYRQENTSRLSNGYTQDHVNPYKQHPGGSRQSTQSPRNPYNGGVSLPSQEYHSSHHRSHNPYHPKSAPAVKRPPSRTHIYHLSGGTTVASYGSSSVGSGGKIRRITESTPFSFSGSERVDAERRTKRPRSPSHSYAPCHSQAPHGYRSQSY